MTHRWSAIGALLALGCAATPVPTTSSVGSEVEEPCIRVAKAASGAAPWGEHLATLCRATSYDDLHIGPEAALSQNRRALHCAISLGAGPEVFRRLASVDVPATRAYARTGLSSTRGWTAPLLEEALGDTEDLNTVVGCRGGVAIGRDIAYQALASKIAPERASAMLVAIVNGGTELPPRTLREAMQIVASRGFMGPVALADLPAGDELAEALRAGAERGWLWATTADSSPEPGSRSRLRRNGADDGGAVEVSSCSGDPPGRT